MICKANSVKIIFISYLLQIVTKYDPDVTCKNTLKVKNTCAILCTTSRES